MKGDFTRFTFDRKRHYSGIRMQQGRVQLDSDWNELGDIQTYRMRTETRDFVGPTGAPRGPESGFAVTGGGQDLQISPGRMYIDGILCENEDTVSITDQPGYTRPPEDGLYLTYLEVWHRHVTAVEDPSLREVGLGGPDTATRVQTQWRVKLHQVGAVNMEADADTAFPDWDAEVAASDARLRADVDTDLGDQLRTGLYRVEVHRVEGGKVHLKWSRNNGSVVAAWSGTKPGKNAGTTELEIDNLGRGAALGIGTGHWIELSDDEDELAGRSGVLVNVVAVGGGEITVKNLGRTDENPDGEPIGPPAEKRHPKLRLWDSMKDREVGEIEVVPDKADVEAENRNWIPLEDGIKVQLTAGRLRAGDYWLIPARSFLPGIVWPHVDGEPAAVEPHGIERRTSRLALVVRRDGEFEEPRDCRFEFLSLTDLRGLTTLGADLNAPDESIYVDGDGNVGIGTDDPGEKLTVNGNVDIRDFGHFAAYDGLATITSHMYGAALRFKARAGNMHDLVVATDGNVGIGTDEPGSVLHLHGDSNKRVMSLVVQDELANAPKTWRLGNDGQPGKFGLMDGSYENYRWIVDSEGRVGIGTEAPLAKLQVHTRGTQPALRLYNDENNAQFNFLPTEESGTKKLKIQEDTEGKNVATILQDGNVGIGTASPGAKLEVAGDLKVTGSGFSIGRNNVNAEIISTDSDGNLNLKPAIDQRAVFIRDGNTNKGIRLYGGGTNTIQSVDLNGTKPTWLVIQPDGGNVGIGTINPGQKLTVHGNIDVNNFGHIASYDGLATITSHMYGVALRFKARAGNVPDLVVATNGNVGIGTPSPGARLHSQNDIADNTPFQALFRIGVNSTNESTESSFNESASSYGIEFRRKWHGAGDNIQAGIYAWGSSSWSSGLAFRTAAPGPDLKTRMVITGNGSVGIGTASPRAKLDVRGSLVLESGTNPCIYGGTEARELGRYLELLNSTASASALGLKAGGVLVSDTFSYANPGKNDLIVKGRTGIGTPGLGPRLTVNGVLGIGSGDRFAKEGHAIELMTDNFFGGVHDNHTGIRMFAYDMNGWGAAKLGVQVSESWHKYNSTPAAIIGQEVVSFNGSVGIGTTSPGARLEVFKQLHPSQSEDLFVVNSNNHLKGSGCSILLRNAHPMVRIRARDVENGEGVMDIYTAQHVEEGDNLFLNFQVQKDSIWSPESTNAAQDYAEYFESTGGREIPPGTSVVLSGDKIRPAKKGEAPVGIISANPGVVGGVHIEWPGKYLRDDLGCLIMQEYQVEITAPAKKKLKREKQKVEKRTIEEEMTRTEVTLKRGKYLQKGIVETVTRDVEEPVFEEVDLYDASGKEVIGKHRVPVMESYEEEVDILDDDGNPVLAGTGEFETRTSPKLNPDYDETREYVPRGKRPEWNCVGLLGKLPLRKGQPVAENWIKMKDISDDVELWLVK